MNLDTSLELMPQRARLSMSDDHLLPLINVVFLLLIFFMLVGALTAPQDGDLRPPESMSTLAPETAAQEVTIGADAALRLGTEVVDLTELAAAMIANPPNGPVSVKADAAIQASDVIDVLDVLRGAGVKRVELVTIARR